MAEQTAQPTAEELIGQGLRDGPAGISTTPLAPAAETADKVPDATAGSPDKPADAPPMSAADVQRMIAEAIMEDRKTRQQENMRERYIREKMSDLPPSMRDLLPQTGDIAELARTEQRLRDEIKEFIAAGVKAGRLKTVDVDGGAGIGGGMKVVRALGSELTPEQEIASGLKM